MTQISEWALVEDWDWRSQQSHAGAVRRAAADTGRRQTPAGAMHAGRQNACGYGGPRMWRNGRRKATAGHGQGGRKEGRKAMHQHRLAGINTAPVFLFRPESRSR